MQKSILIKKTLLRLRDADPKIEARTQYKQYRNSLSNFLEQKGQISHTIFKAIFEAPFEYHWK